MTTLSNLRNLDNPVLITGHTGFKGAWLGLLLNSINVPYVGVSLEPAKKSLYSRIENEFAPEREYFQDIRNLSALRQIFISHKPSAVLHLAAQPLVLDSYKDPIGTFETNVMGTANVLEAARSIDNKIHIAVITTDKVYRNLEQERKFIESDPIQGFDPYSASKAAAENVISAWRSFGKPESQLIISAMRAGNVIGGGDYSENRLVPDLVRAFQSNKTPSIRNPKSIRPWQHVLDPLVGYLLALERSFSTDQPEDFNFGPSNTALSVEDVTKIACETWGDEQKYEKLENLNQVHEAKFLDLSSEKARDMLSWEPGWSQEEAIKATVNWWKSLDGKSAFEACEVDLELAKSHYKLL